MLYSLRHPLQNCRLFHLAPATPPSSTTLLAMTHHTLVSPGMGLYGLWSHQTKLRFRCEPSLPPHGITLGMHVAKLRCSKNGCVHTVFQRPMRASLQSRKVHLISALQNRAASLSLFDGIAAISPPRTWARFSWLTFPAGAWCEQRSQHRWRCKALAQIIGSMKLSKWSGALGCR